MIVCHGQKVQSLFENWKADYSNIVSVFVFENSSFQDIRCGYDRGVSTNDFSVLIYLCVCSVLVSFHGRQDALKFFHVIDGVGFTFVLSMMSLLRTKKHFATDTVIGCRRLAIVFSFLLFVRVSQADTHVNYCCTGTHTVSFIIIY